MGFDTHPYFPLGDVGVTLYDCLHKTPAAQEEGYSYIAIPNIQDGRLNLADVRLISKEDLEEWNKRAAPQAGDVLITRRGRVGDSATVPPGLECAIGQNIVILRADGCWVDQSYLRWAVRGPEWDREVARFQNVGAVFYSLNCRDIPKMHIPVPSLSVQRAISKILASLDDKIELLDRQSETLQVLGDALFGEHVAGMATLAEVADVTMGQAPPGTSYRDHPAGLPLFQGSKDFGFRFPTPQVWCVDPKRVAEPRQVLVSVRAPVGALNVAAERCVIGRGVAALASERPSTLLYALRRVAESWGVHESGGTIFGSISKAGLRQVQLPWPEHESAALEDRLDALDAKIANAHAQRQTMADLRDALLPKLLSGELRVPDAERLVEDVA